MKRFLRRLAPADTRATLRLEADAGAEAQVDFGFAGPLLDPESARVRRAWVFVMVLAHSRHQYAEVVFDQTIATWRRLHRAAIVHAALYDPEVQRSYRDFAEHYGFLIAARPDTSSTVMN